MSFSIEIKDELSKLDFFSREECISELGAMVRMNGTIRYNSQGVKVIFTTENNPIARRIFAMIKFLYKQDPLIHVSRNNQLRRKSNYKVILEHPRVTKKFLKHCGIETGIFGLLSGEIPDSLIEGQEKKKAFLRGAFLGAGSIANPTSMYHMEMVCSTVEFAESLVNIMKSFNLGAKWTERKDQYIVYLKESKKISDFLAVVGAHQGLLKFEDVRVLKEVRNNVNRIVNCDTANVNKTINAAFKQVQAIQHIDEKIGLQQLDPKLQELCILRLSNSEMSLKELGAMMTPPLGKSGVNHLMKKIFKIASELKK